MSSGSIVRVWYSVKGPLLTESYRATDETPEAGAPPGPAGSLKETETWKVSEPWLAPSELMTWLVGAVVSISQEVESVPVPAMPFWSWMSAALTVSVYWPWAVVSPTRPPIA